MIQIARQVTRTGVDEPWMIEPKGALRLEAAILEHLHDPMLAEVLKALFGMVATLYERERSPTAARMLVAVLARVEPPLRVLWGDLPEDSARAEDAQRRVRSVLGAQPERFPPPSSSPAPQGAIAVRTLNIPALPRPSSNALTSSATADSTPGGAGAAPVQAQGPSWPPRSTSETRGSEARVGAGEPSRSRAVPRYRLADDPPAR